MKSLSEVLSENNVRLLKIIAEKKPASLNELAQLSGRKVSNLSRTLKTMERYGIVELVQRNRTVQPITKATAFNITMRFKNVPEVAAPALRYLMESQTPPTSVDDPINNTEDIP